MADNEESAVELIQHGFAKLTELQNDHSRKPTELQNDHSHLYVKERAFWGASVERALKRSRPNPVGATNAENMPVEAPNGTLRELRRMLSNGRGPPASFKIN